MNNNIIKQAVQNARQNSEWHRLSQNNKEREKYLCAHCLAGVVVKLPAHCPECNKYLNKEVNKNRREKDVERL